MTTGTPDDPQQPAEEQTPQVPPMRAPAAEDPSSASRPQRQPFLSTETRPALTDQAASGRAIVQRAQRRRARRMDLTRRQFVRVSFWGVLGFGLTGSLAAFLSFFWPRGVQGFGGRIAVSANIVPEVGSGPARVVIGKFWLSNLAPGEGTFGAFGEPGAGGLLALFQVCPHLGCTVPWRQEFVFGGEAGWFRCPCHGSTYSKAGVRVFGPAPRPMDTMDITVNDDGSLTVDTGAITKGAQNNPRRAVPYSG